MKELFNRNPVWATVLLSVVMNFLFILLLFYTKINFYYLLLLLAQIITGVVLANSDKWNKIGKGILLGFALSFLIGFSVCTAGLLRHL